MILPASTVEGWLPSSHFTVYVVPSILRGADPALPGRRADHGRRHHQGVVTESKSGQQAILARRVIDTTGDADIAYRAGALRGFDRHLPQVHRRLWHPDPAHDGSLLSGALRDPRSAERREPAGRRALRGRRQGLARCCPQSDVLRGNRAPAWSLPCLSRTGRAPGRWTSDEFRLRCRGKGCGSSEIGAVVWRDGRCRLTLPASVDRFSQHK